MTFPGYLYPMEIYKQIFRFFIESGDDGTFISASENMDLFNETAQNKTDDD